MKIRNRHLAESSLLNLSNYRHIALCVILFSSILGVNHRLDAQCILIKDVVSPGASSNGTFGIWQVPAGGPFKIKITGPVQFDIMDISGRVVKSEKRDLLDGYNEVTLDINTLATGLHFIKIKDSGNHEAVVKVSKM